MDWTIGKRTQFPPGKSPNPGGRTKGQRQLEVALADALVSDDPIARAQELAEITWTAARRFEPWAVQLLFAKLMPTPITIEPVGSAAETIAHFKAVFISAASSLPDEHRERLARAFLAAGDENGDDSDQPESEL